MNSNDYKIGNSQELLLDKRWKKAITSKRIFQSEVSEVLVAARACMGMTQSVLAKKIKTTQSAIARAESGRFMPNLSFIGKIAKAYKTNARIVFESMPDAVPIAIDFKNKINEIKECQHWLNSIRTPGNFILVDANLSSGVSLALESSASDSDTERTVQTKI